jgi:ABC-2 type transport system ATP-binding protein
MWEFLKQINKQGVTIILTTHYLEEAEMLCRTIGIIDTGLLVECTTMKALLSKLDVETFIFDLRHDLDVAPMLTNMNCRLTDAHTLEVDVAKSNNINELFTQLTAANIEVLSMRNKANRLEELFVELVEKAKESK